MFNNLETGGNLSTLTEEELEAAMGPADTSKKKSASKPTDEEGKDKNKIKKTTKIETKPITKKAEVTTLSSKDAATAFSDSEDEDEEKEDEDEEKESNEDNENEEKSSVKDEDNDTDNEDEENDEDEPGEEDEEERIKDFIKARVELLIKSGRWADWDGRDKTEWNEETFAEMELQQDDNKRNKIREELLASFGPYGKQIAEFSEDGGDPDELIDIFKEEQRAQALSIESEDSQRDVVFLYETQFLNKKPERVRKYIDGLIADKELSSEAKEAKEKMEEYWANERESLVQSQAETAKEQKRRQKENLEKFSGEVSKFVTSSKDIPDPEKQAIIKVLTKFDKKGPNGLPVNDFFFKFAEFKKDLPNYIDLVRFVLDPKKFSKQLKNEGKTESVEKGFNLIRQNNKSKKTRSSGSGSSGSKKSNFRLMY
jgi:hypothetical protein